MMKANPRGAKISVKREADHEEREGKHGALASLQGPGAERAEHQQMTPSNSQESEIGTASLTFLPWRVTVAVLSE